MDLKTEAELVRNVRASSGRGLFTRDVSCAIIKISFRDVFIVHVKA